MWKIIFEYIKPYIEKSIPSIIKPILDKRLEEFRSELRKNEFEFSSVNEGKFKAAGFLKTIDFLSQQTRSIFVLVPALQASYPHLSVQEAENVLKSCIEAIKLNNSDVLLENFITSNHDWFNEFIKLSGKFSAEDAHKLWGSVLATELENPSSVSYRTMQSIANLTPDECLGFKSLFPYILDGKYIFFSEPIISKTGLNDLSELLFDLEDIGILKFVSSRVSLNIQTQQINGYEGVTFRALTKDITIYVGDRVYRNSEYGKTISLQNAPNVRTIDLTKVGQEIFSVLKAYEELDDSKQLKYLESVGEHIKEKMHPINVTYKIIER